MRVARGGVVVLGMHRSGTSAVAAVLSQLGLCPPRADDALHGPWNPKGHYESQRLNAMDDRLLSEMDRTWWYPPPAGEAYWEVASRIRTTASQARRAFRKAYPARGWVWKDPRTCLLLPFWRRALGDEVAAVVVFRNPLEVARSLASRNQTGTSFGLALWERYNRLLMTHLRGMPALVTSFHDLVADPRQWCERASVALSGAGIRLAARPDVGWSSEVDGALRHSVHSRRDLEREHPATLELYDTLCGMVGWWPSFEPPPLGPEPGAVQARLDELGPDTPPAWRPPPWSSAGSAGISANSDRGPAAD